VVCFLSFWPLYFWRAITFSILFFWTIFNALNVPIRGVQILFRCKLQWKPCFIFGMPWVLKCYSCNSIATNKQLKDLTHMFCFRIPCYKLYTEGLFSYVLKFKFMCHFGMSWKKFNPKAKHKIKNKISWLFFNAFSLMLSYLFTYLWLCMT
jgi:hypothetical protein